MKKTINKNKIIKFLCAFILLITSFNISLQINLHNIKASDEYVLYSNIPEYSNRPYTTINDNEPFFNDSDLVTDSYETYASMDEKGRCQVAKACIGRDIMPKSKRGKIGMVRPSGWHTVKYNGVVEGNYLYNRCHLIAYCLSGENANRKNLITGTRYMNTDGMEPFEQKIKRYVKKTKNHVLYRVTPRFEGDNLVASGVFMEAKSVEDDGKGICFCVYCYNVQPNVIIDYKTGDSSLTAKGEEIYQNTLNRFNRKSDDSIASPNSKYNQTTPNNGVQVAQPPADGSVVWISNSGTKYHSKPNCSNMKNPTQITKEEAERKGKSACKKCY